MLCRKVLLFALALAMTSAAPALPFDPNEKPTAWGCPNLLVADSGELVVMPLAIGELARVPWDRHFGTTVHIHLPVKELIDVTRDGIPFQMERTDAFVAGGFDRDHRLRQRLLELRALALRRNKHLWQMVVVTTSPPRLYFLDRLDFNDAEFHRHAEQDLSRAFRPGGLIAEGEAFTMFVLSADPEGGAPPTLAELGFHRGLYQFVRRRTLMDHPDLALPTNLATLLKATSTPTIPNILFAYDPGLDFTGQWEDGPEDGR